jgi:hypothetical protein
MVRPLQCEEEICRFMADEYAAKVMCATYGKALSIQQISESCEIPVAVAYRRVKKMVSLGMLNCVKEQTAYRGKKERFYLCAVDTLKYSFVHGAFTCQILRETDSADDQKGVRSR